MSRFLPLLLLVAACGGAQVATERSEPTSRCRVNRGPNDVTFVEDPAHGYGFSLPPPAAWELECIDEEGRLLRGTHADMDAAVTVSLDAAPGNEADAAYLRRHVREAREQLRERGLEVTTARFESLEGVLIGSLEIRSTEEGETSVHVAAFSILRTASGGVLRFRIVLPTEGRFGHRDNDPIARRAQRVALSFGSLD